MKKLSRDAENVHVYIDAGNKPKLRISPGESFCLETIRADNNFLSRDNPVYRDFKHVMEVPANPVTGPVFVEGAEPGDRIAVSIEDIRLGDSGNEGYYTYVPGQGLFTNRFVPEVFPSSTYFCDVSGKTLTFKTGIRDIELPIHPFIGTICVAMENDVTLSYYAGREMVGNLDCPNVRKGSVIVMPVNVPGALLSIGDLHALQGDGELLGCAVEADGIVTLSIELIKKGDPRYFNWPQVDGNARVGSVCTIPNNIEAAIRGAVHDVIKRIEVDKGIPFMEAYMLIGQCVKVQICQMIAGACTAYAYLDQKLAASLDAAP
jgi:acetamidase/formamidase